MSTKTELTDTAYDILKVLGKDADFCTTQLRLISKMQKANKKELAKTWQAIIQDKKRHMHLLKEALEKEVKSRTYLRQRISWWCIGVHN